MKFRFLVAALAVVIAGGAILGSRATTTQALAGDPNISITCPAVVIQGSSFACTIGIGATPNPYTGYQFVVIYDSPVGPSGTPPGTGTAFTATSLQRNYSAAAVWGGAEFCPPDSLNSSSPLLPTGYMGSGGGCVSLAGPASGVAIPNFAQFNFTANGLGSHPIHIVSLAGGGASFGTYTIDTSSAPQANTYSCGGATCIPSPFGDPFVLQDPLVTVVLPPADVSLTKTASVPSVVQSQSLSFTLTATNNSTTSPAPAVTVTDNVPAAFTIGVLPAGCGAVGQLVTCTAASVPALGSVAFIIPVTASSGAGTTVSNCASETNSSVPADPSPANNTNICASVVIIPPAVAWSKVADNPQTFLCEAGSIGTQGCTADGKNGNVSFEEVMTNQGDPNGLAAFEFTLHFDNTIFNAPTICGLNISICPATGSFVDLTDAVSLLLAGGRTSVTCTMSIPLETEIHVACASTGPIGVGPVFVGAKDMADVQLQIKDNVRGSLFPTKENGIVTRVDDTGTELANTCGQPLNDGTGFVVPGQTTECQGVPLLGILPGGQVADSHLFITIRRLEGDVTKDCSVTVADMQAEATRYGYGFGSLLYQIWYDLEPHTTGADGDIDIKDVQFVFGRFGSECNAPIPPQVPQTPVDP
jgi:hypothetical protein